METIPALTGIQLAQESSPPHPQRPFETTLTSHGQVCVILDPELGKKPQTCLRLGSVLTGALKICSLRRDSQQITGARSCPHIQVRKLSLDGSWAVKPSGVPRADVVSTPPGPSVHFYPVLTTRHTPPPCGRWESQCPMHHAASPKPGQKLEVEVFWKNPAPAMLLDRVSDT